MGVGTARAEHMWLILNVVQLLKSRNSYETGVHILFRKFQFDFLDLRVNSAQSKDKNIRNTLQDLALSRFSPDLIWPSPAPDLVQTSLSNTLLCV